MSEQKSKLTKFTAKINFESGLGNKFEDKYTSEKNDGVPALLATIEKLSFIAKVAGAKEGALRAMEEGFGEDQ